MRKKLLITGGHLTPALALIDELVHSSDVQLVFVGRDHALEGQSVTTEERREITKRGIKFIPFYGGRLSRTISIVSLISFLKIPLGFLRSLTILHHERPSGVVTFGGYIGLPIGLASWLLGIPIIIHEQTLSPGFANRVLGKIAKRICVTYEKTVRYFPQEKTVVTGLPLRKDLFSEYTKELFPKGVRPIVYITGGSTGSTSINALVKQMLPSLLVDMDIIHQTGKLSFIEFQNIKKMLPADLSGRYHVFDVLDGRQIQWALTKATVIVGRSGANTVGEIAALGKIALFIPLPWAAHGEQEENAKYLTSRGSAELLHQDGLTGEILAQKIRYMIEHYSSYDQAAKKLATTIPRNGARRLAQVVEATIE